MREEIFQNLCVRIMLDGENAPMATVRGGFFLFEYYGERIGRFKIY
jgi:hypothetical protein